MNKKDLFIFLGLQILAIGIAGAAFAMIESRLVAGLIAGSYFVSSGLFFLFKISHWRDKWRSLALYPITVHVFMVSIPMMVTRFLNRELVFEDVKILGLSGPEFHRISTWIFMATIMATLIDLGRVWTRPSQH